MSLEVIDFTERQKAYKFEAGEFTLKPPYMDLVETVKRLSDNLAKAINAKAINNESASEDELKEFKKVGETYLEILKLVLEETDKGKLSDITAENLRQDVAEVIIKDFFYQYKQ
jgi:predicted peptidase